MITLRPAAERGHTNHGWLETYHTFSFADFHDPRRIGFRELRVINDDRVAAGEGFSPHSHRDMEIITYMVEGQLEHRDNLGNGAVLKPGDVQHMTAGTGVVHSEFNHSQEKPLRLLQIWIFPEKKGLVPDYQDRHFDPQDRVDRLRLIASTDGRDNSLIINQDVDLYDSSLTHGTEVQLALRPERHAWLQVINGELALNGQTLKTGDGAAISAETALKIRGQSENAEFLLFDLK
ncbi:Pirin-like protein [Candidatus Koribacter versatilis Ellin345]|uniref:Pirin-like protein n=1 Tax=Koribacter versatilis (strain Ellin345) TaxID=204669 RepID=Q1IQJ7_KORVE|nr:pirin family protein [Candidatus Koribacter versatilis]ABF40853.1 Pirin-like protein [Candidatus Koribacter versatilis Ellin345]